MGDTQAKSILLFDGICNLCNGAVQFILLRDPKEQFQFAALQSEPGARLLEEHHLPKDKLDTLVLIEDGQAFQRSTAALRIARKLSGAWPVLFYLFIWIPGPIRDFFYNLIAKNRYKMFGQQESCMVPTPERRARFLT